MAKRKLSKHQQWRIEKIQQERASRFDKKNSSITENYQIDSEQVFDGRVVQNYGQSLIVQELNSKNRYRCTYRQNIGELVVGDVIRWQKITAKLTVNEEDYQGIIIALCPRKTLLSRPDFQGKEKPIAANIDQAFIVSSPNMQIQHNVHKMLNIRLIDRYLIVCERNGIIPIIIFNKMDLLTNYHEELNDIIALYQQLNYQIICTSVPNHLGINEIIKKLSNSNSIFVGQSGMGKSSLLNIIFPDANAKIGDISLASGKGKHTTSSAKLYSLTSLEIEDAFLIDSPGIRELGIWKLAKADVENGFKEIQQYASQCKFRNCQHNNEPGCAVLHAIEEHQISAFRFHSFQNIIESLVD